MKISLYDYCVANGRDELLRQWDTKKNVPLAPTVVTYASSRKVWWVCDKGHEYEATINHRSSHGSGCPYCGGTKVLAGFNDLATLAPELAAQWHPTLNGELTPDKIACYSRRKVWWQCKAGHEWLAQVCARAGKLNRQCPFCSANAGETRRKRQRVLAEEAKKRMTDSASTKASDVEYATLYDYCIAEGRGDILRQWNDAKNAPSSPKTVKPFSNHKAWWICDKGHEYETQISNFSVHGSDCPYCGGRKVLPGLNDLATLEPEIAAQWHPTLNGDLTPNMIARYSRKKVWWQCEKGHEWFAFIHGRTGKGRSGCPFCNPKASKTRCAKQPELLNEAKAKLGVQD